MKDLNVLVVDDNKMDRTVVRAVLNKLGIKRVTEAENGSIAQSKLQTAIELNDPFHLTILDWNMPSNNGMAVLKYIRADLKLKSCKVILMTASSARELVQEAIEHGVNDFIVKPIQLPVLKEKIEKLF